PVTLRTPVTFTMTGGTDPSPVDVAAGLKYSFDFDNNGTFEIPNSASPTASFTYATAGTYTARGRISDKDSGFTDYTTTVTVNPTAPTANARPDLTGNDGSPVSFQGSGTGTGASYSWTFGDGPTAARLLPRRPPTADNAATPAPLPVTASLGRPAPATALATIANVAPTAASFTNNGPVTLGSPVTFTMTGGTDPSTVDVAAGLKYSFDFDNNGTFEITNSASPTASFTYAAAGTYTARGRISDKDGGFTDYTTTATVTPPAPTANAGPALSGNEGSPVSFQGSGTGTGLSYSWTFGDGTTGTGATPSHTYADNGTYTATLTVTDSLGRTATATALATIANVAPTAASFTNNGPVTLGSPVTFTMTGGTDPSTVDVAAGLKYSFDFDNNGTFEITNSASPTASFTYATAGTYTARGRISDKDGGFTDYTTTVTVNPTAPTANAGPALSGNEGSPVSFQGSGTGTGLTYSWTFGDGTTGTGATPSHTYADNGTYTATLTVTDSLGRPATATALATIANVAPTATSFTNNGPVTVGSATTFTFTNPTDPSSVDVAAGLKYSFDFDNNGTFEITNS